MLMRLDFLFFFKQKTAYEMRSSDSSSDVCSSDLRGQQHAGRNRDAGRKRPEEGAFRYLAQNVLLPPLLRGRRFRADGEDKRERRRGRHRLAQGIGRAGALRARQPRSAADLLWRLFRPALSAPQARQYRRAGPLTILWRVGEIGADPPHQSTT